MASHQQHKTAVVALFLAALVLASPAAGYRPEAGYAPSTPAEAAPAEPAVSTPAESGTPVADGYAPGAADTTPAEEKPTDAVSTPAQDTPSDAAVSTPTEASTPAQESPTDTAVSTPADAGYNPGAATSTPAEATPTEAAASTPAEATPTEAAASTPAESSTRTEATPTEAAASTPAEATPTEAAASTPADAGTPDAAGYTPAAGADTTPAATPGKATTEEQKLMEMVNAAYKKALEAANAAAPDDKFRVFDAAFDKGIKEGLTDKTEEERGVFTGLVDKAVKDAYASTSASTAGSEEERFSVFVFTLTEALRVMAATLEAHAVKPATEEAVAGGVKAPAGEQYVIGKIDAAVKVAAAAAKDAPSSDRFLVFEATFTKAFKDAMGPAYDENKTVPQLNAAYKEAYKACVVASPKAKFDAFREALTSSIRAMGKAVKAGVATKPAAQATTEPAAQATTEPAAQATTEPAATKPAAAKPKSPGAGTVGGYNV